MHLALKNSYNDVRIFWRYVLNDAIYRSIYDDVHEYAKTHDQANRVSKQASGPRDESELEYQVKLRKGRAQYEELHHAQLAALQKGRDYEVSSTAFRSLSNLEKITLSESFAPTLNCYALAYVDPTWPSSLMQRLRGSSIPPMQWILSSHHPSMEVYEPIHGRLIPTEFRKWHCHLVINLLHAAALYCPKVKELRLGHPDCQVEQFVFAKDRDDDSVRDLMARLEVLEVHCHSTFIHVQEHRSRLVSFVDHAQGLKSLSITLDVGESISKAVYTEPRWPNLTRLELSKMSLRSDDLGSFLINHRQTLSELTLNKMIRLMEGDWDQLANTLGDSLRLDRVCLFVLSKTWDLSRDWIIFGVGYPVA